MSLSPIVHQFALFSKTTLMNHFPVASYVYKKIHKIPIQKQSESLKAQSSLACHLSVVGAVGSIFKSSLLGASIFGVSAILSYRAVQETEKFERLERAINSLNKVNSDLKMSHKKFKKNANQMIDKLKNNNIEFQSQIGNLKNNNEDFQSQNDVLKKEIEKLENLILIARKTNDELFKLQQKHGATANLYEAISNNLEGIKKSFETREVNLGQKIEELSREISRLQEIKA